MVSITAQELISASVISRGWMGMGMVKYTMAPVISMPSAGLENSTLRVMMASMGRMAPASRRMSTTLKRVLLTFIVSPLC